MDAGPLEVRFARWLREEAGITEPRRIVRRDADHILVSKFEPGFAARLHDAMARLPELFDEPAVGAAYRSAAAASSGYTRVEAWHAALRTLVASLAPARAISADQRSEIMAGVDSVAALMDSILWTSPRASEPYSPSASEEDAYRDALARMDADPGIFTRFYGTFEGASVVNHCPGAPFGRAFVAQAWAICTGSQPVEN